MTCNCNNNCGSGVCDPTSSTTAIQQAVTDALAGRVTELDGYATSASASASSSSTSAADAASSASAAAQSKTDAETAASTAAKASKVVSDTAVILEGTANSLSKAQDLLEQEIAAIQTKPFVFEVSSPTSSLVLPDTDTVFNVRSIRIQGVTQDVGYGFTFDKETKTVTLSEGITAEDISDTGLGYVLVTVVGDIYNSDDPSSYPITLESNVGAKLVGTESGETVQQALDNTDQFAGAYESGPLTIKNPNRWITYNGTRWYVNPDVSLPITTSGNSSDSWLNDKSNFLAVGGVTALETLKTSTGFGLIGQVGSFSELRNTVPTYEGQRILLSAWNADVTPYGQSSFGGDEFVAISGSYADDGGFTAKVSDSWAWQRCRNKNEATVLHFGGVSGGTFDNHDAIMRMHVWSQGLGGVSAPGIIFPAGVFYTSPVDFTTAAVSVNNHTFNLHGPEVTHGKHCQLTILSDKSLSPVFKIEAYDGDIAFFNFDGQATISGTTPSNAQPFLENIQSGPQNVHIRYWYLKSVGGLGFKLSDTLDTRFDETYCDGVYGGLYEIDYDNQSSGNWDHPTAIEWSNFNYQNVYPSPVFKSPRLRQAIIKNGWIEKSNPGDLTDSQIAMITLCIEDCYTDTSGNVSYLDLRNSNFTLITSDIQPQYMKTGYNVDTAWNTSYLPGQSLVEPHGLFTSHGTVASRMSAGPLLINTYSNSVETWYYVGKFWFQDIGSSMQIKVTGDAGAAWDTSAIYPWSTQHGGHTLINIQRKSDGSAQHVNWSNHGGPVTDVRFTGGGGNNLELWVKVGINAMCSLRANVSSPGDVVAQYNNTNLSATLWFGDIVKQDPPSDAKTPMTSWINRAGWQQDSSGNARQGGLGIASDGRLIAGAATLDLMSGESSSGVTRNLVLYIDGVPYAITATQITTS